MVSIAYVNDGKSLYDYFLLRKLHERFDTVFLSFNSRPTHVPDEINVVTIPELFWTLPAHDGPRIYSTIPLKTMMLKRALKNLKPDILIGCGALGHGFCSALSGYEPFVLFVWGRDVSIFPKFPPFHAMAQSSLRKANLVFVDSNAHFKACTELGCTENKIVKFPWADSQELEISAKNVNIERDEFRKRFGWFEEDPIIICTRMHEEIYNIECIVRSIPVVLDRVKNARFIFLGTGTLTMKLKQLVNDLNVEKSVSFTGFIPKEKIFYCLKNSDIYVSSSLSDGASSSLLEAMVCKLACVVSDIPGNREWINEMENGLLFPVKDSQVLAEKIIVLLAQKNLSRSMAENAFRTVREKADWQKNSTVLFNLIEKLAY